MCKPHKVVPSLGSVKLVSGGQENMEQVFSPLRTFFLVETRKRVSTAPSTSDTPWSVLPRGTGSYPFSLELERKMLVLSICWGESLLGRKAGSTGR